jgi:carboxypeptidase C (cathepsin A)
MSQPESPSIAHADKVPTTDADDLARRQRERVGRALAQAPSRTTGSVQTADGRIDYAVCAEFVPVRAAGLDGPHSDPEAAVFTTAYRVGDDPDRPVCFAFNGGPGSASIWLHLGALGPKRVVVPDDASMPRPPYDVVDNPLTWLRHFDLVFIDPPHTGWSVSAGGKVRERLLGVDGDIAALVDVIQGWLDRHRRWGAPVYLAGESYGTTRGAAMADKLLGAGVALAGLIFVSCAMDLQSLVFAPRNDLPYALFLPAFANVAQYHGRLRGPLGRSPEAARAAAEAFVDDDYLAALHAGARLSDASARRVARRLAELTGLPRELIERQNLRVDDGVFFVELLREHGRILGRLDARATAPVAARQRHEFEFDPGMEAIEAPYATAAMRYFTTQLGLHEGVQAGQRYEVLSLEAHKQWNWNRNGPNGEPERGNSYACTSDDLSRALRRNPHLRVLVASGRYDLGTPYSASDWSLAQLDITPDVRRRVTHRCYDAGHMMYTREADLRQLAADLADWLAATV